ncbi:MAG: lysylphosphatidylglycerol synthase transmembrane domain-containing protein [Candidatus Methanoperedens sp.]|nr:lysylphosphatidylglycerol synthase transmembrane domain-containing protein [Candidatus Methanoperedens sp.]
MKLGNIIFIARFAALILILLLIDFEHLVLILRSINLDLLVLAVLLDLAGFLVWTWKWKFIANKLENVKFTTLFLGLMSGNCLNSNVLRARTFGGFGRAMFLKNITKDHEHGNWYATIVIDQTTNAFVFSIPVVFSLLFIIMFLKIPWWLSILLESIAIILFMLSVFAYMSKHRIKRTTIVRVFYSILKRIYDLTPLKFIRNRYTYQKFEELVIKGIIEFKKTYGVILRDKRIVMRDIGLSIIMFVFIYAKAYVIFRSVGYNITILSLIVSLTLTLWIISILLIPGGLGVKELIMIGIYSMVGVPVTTAAVVSLIDRAIYMFFVVVIAYAATVINRIFHIGERTG